MAVRKILLLGNPELYKNCAPINKGELSGIKTITSDLHDTLTDFRKKYNTGRAIAAPQIGVMKRIVYMYIDKPVVFINPVLSDFSEEKIELWDDCMSFPGLFVKVKRHVSCTISYHDENWDEQKLELKGDLSELLQHEVDHLDGILATMRAIDNQSFAVGVKPI